MHNNKGKYYIKIIKSQQMILHDGPLLVEEDKEGQKHECSSQQNP